ncbi:hypothetical protein CIK06_07485 [Plantactinospora sp. KBS50]|nr:hypothetical protein CIK06_07485 [Plantactinospora sp. KBS50]
MIALPVLGLSFAAASYDMFRLTPDETANRRLGTADALVQWLSDGPVNQDPAGDGYSFDGRPRRSATSAELLAALPAGSRVSPVVQQTWPRLRTAAGVGTVAVRGLDLADPLTRGLATVLTGRAPAGPGEAVLSVPAERRLGVRIGDPVELADGSRRWTVVGTVETPDNLREVLVVPPASIRDGVLGTDFFPAWLVDTPAPVDWAQVRRLNAEGMAVTSRAVLLDPPPASQLAMPPQTGSGAVDELSIGVLIGGLAVLEVVLLAGPAFAVGARRRRRELALLAANGGTPGHQRRLVLADGVVLGLAGAMLGIVLGVALAISVRPLVEEHMAHSRAGGYRVFPLALLGIAALAVATGVLAALVPAVTAARQDVLAGLTGRRGVLRSRRRWLVAGLALAVLGPVLACYGAGQLRTGLVLAGLVLAEVGLVFCTPSLVGLIARAGRLLPLAPRIALRETARNRGATSPAISAIMAAVAGTVALGIFLAGADARTARQFRDTVPLGHITVTLGGDDSRPDQATGPVTAAQVGGAAAGLPVSAVAEVRLPTCRSDAPGKGCAIDVRVPESQRCPYPRGGPPTGADTARAARDPRCAQTAGWYQGSFVQNVVDDGAALPLLTGATGEDLRRARAMLAAGGVVVTDPRLVTGGRVDILVDDGTGRTDPARTPDSPLPTISVPAYVLSTGIDLPRQFYPPELIRRVGLAEQPWGFVLGTDAVPTVAQQDALTAALHDLAPGLTAEVARGRPERDEDPMLLVLALAAALITLGAAGIATGLVAADSRADLSTLAAVGAGPGVRRVLSLSQSGTIAGLGSLLGTAAGLTAAAAIILAYNQGFARSWPVQPPYPFTVPWTVPAVLAVVPLVATAGAGLLTRSRLPVERRAG